MLPSRHLIDYDALLRDARQECALDFSPYLQERLPSLWRNAYLGAISHEPNLVRFGHRSSECVLHELSHAMNMNYDYDNPAENAIRTNGNSGSGLMMRWANTAGREYVFWR
jgi:hypothetical protein